MNDDITKHYHAVTEPSRPTSIVNPYVAVKLNASEWAVMFRFLLNDKMDFKPVCSKTSDRDAKLIAKLLNKNMETV